MKIIGQIVLYAILCCGILELLLCVSRLVGVLICKYGKTEKVELWITRDINNQVWGFTDSMDDLAIELAPDAFPEIRKGCIRLACIKLTNKNARVGKGWRRNRDVADGPGHVRRVQLF